MKRTILGLLFTVLIAASCERNGGNEEYVIEGTGIEAPNSMSTIKATIANHGTVAESPFVNGGFELTLPASLPESALFQVSTKETTKGASASDPAARLAFLNFEVDLQTASISFDDSHLHDGLSGGTKQAAYIYADRPVKLSGESETIETFQPRPSVVPATQNVEHTFVYSDLTLKAGWNMICEEMYIESSEPLVLRTTFSHKSLSDCRWNIFYLEIDYDDHGNPVFERWRPQE